MCIALKTSPRPYAVKSFRAISVCESRVVSVMETETVVKRWMEHFRLARRPRRFHLVHRVIASPVHRTGSSYSVLTASRDAPPELDLKRPAYNPVQVFYRLVACLCYPIAKSLYIYIYIYECRGVARIRERSATIFKQALLHAKASQTNIP
jgi:hypothetical protein